MDIQKLRQRTIHIWLQAKNGESDNGLVNRLLADAIPDFIPVGAESNNHDN